jgi:small subunit ribosomal protein S21
LASYHKNYYPEERAGICVVRRKGESDEEFLKRFRKKYSKSGITKELRDRMYYEKPSDKKRRKKLQSIRLIQREEEKAIEQQERFEKLKQKRKKQQAKARRKGERYDKRSSRQNSSEVSKSE